MSQRKISKRASSEVTPLLVKVARNIVTIPEETVEHPTSLVATESAETKLLFSPGRYLVYSRFNDQDQIHIREYGVMTMTNGMGQCEYPTKKGVCFTPGRLKVLRNKLDEIDENLKNHSETSTPYKAHLGAGIYASIEKFNGVDLRRHWIPEGHPSIVPTKRGIYLPAFQWRMFKEKLNELLNMFPSIAAAEECFHQNQMELIDCRECLPFGWMMA